MTILSIELDLITGFLVGFEWVPKGTLDDPDNPFGYIAVDLGIVRFVVAYN